jgi:adenine-specific DNA-methyltransferase
MSSLGKFQQLLRQLFQFDCADLDFGIYRILNYKRKQVEEFITHRLPQIVDEAFEAYAEAEKENLQREIERKRREICVKPSASKPLINKVNCNWRFGKLL